ncbi:MAG: protein kinase [Phycisphaerales bacterium]|nr:protein kinase [Phycisphaerales bacterium]
MGTVWLARRADGLFERDVAVKFVRRGMDSDTVVRRFHNERAVLATLIHPNIGQMYDGGTTRAGHPYLVMEYVQGVPIIEYCESARLDIDDRLRLFRKVCLAAHHAHRHLILHRDVKPANILVADNGVPKLLDFGIAKLLDAHENGNSEFTATDLRPLTPRYASPEQVRGERLTTATDVYSLGVVLFELLTGRQKRKVDFRKGLRLGRGDVVTVWSRPAQWRASCGLRREEFERLPALLPVRLVRITHAIKGFRSRTIVVATTLLDPVETPADEIRALYRCRWTAELNLRSLKTHLGMEVLRGKSVEVVAKEIAMHVLVYNLARVAMWRVAQHAGCDPRALSLTGTLHRLRHALPLLLHAPPPSGVHDLLRYLVHALACDRLPYRPDRYEPRRVKRRAKPHDLLLKPRSWYYQRMK